MVLLYNHLIGGGASMTVLVSSDVYHVTVTVLKIFYFIRKDPIRTALVPNNNSFSHWVKLENICETDCSKQ